MEGSVSQPAAGEAAQVFLDEFQEARGVRLTDRQVTALRRIVASCTAGAAEGRVGGFRISASGEAGRYDLFPGSWVGVLGLPGLEVIIRPKLPVERLLYLICRGLGLGRVPIGEAGYRTAGSLLEVMGYLFAGRLEPIVQRGLLHGYRSEEDALHVVRGRIRLQDQLARRYGRMPPAEVRYDEYTQDIELNRILKAALERLRRMPARDRYLHDTLRSFAGAFAFVSRCDYRAGVIPRITYTRLNRRYRPAIEVARLVLRGVSLEIPSRGDPAGARGYGFLVDMNEIFEAFVYEALREELELSRVEFPRGGETGSALHLDRERRIRLRPDLSWWVRGECCFVGDVKYKRVDTRGYQQGDYYQLLAYVTAARVPEGLLIYAGGESEEAVHHVGNSDKVLQVVTLDAGGAIEDIESQVRLMAERVRRIAGRSGRCDAA